MNVIAINDYYKILDIFPGTVLEILGEGETTYKIETPKGTYHLLKKCFDIYKNVNELFTLKREGLVLQSPGLWEQLQKTYEPPTFTLHTGSSGMSIFGEALLRSDMWGNITKTVEEEKEEEWLDERELEERKLLNELKDL